MRIDIYTRLDPEFALCRELRTRIFVDELDLPLSRERDDRDYGAAHYLISLIKDSSPVGVCRSYIQGDYCVIERLGLLPEYRGFNLAKKALGLVLDDCRQRYPLMPVLVYAPTDYEHVFADSGFVADGESFVSAGLSYRPMILRHVNAGICVKPDVLMSA